MYLARTTDPDLTKHFLTSFEVGGTPQAQAGSSSTLTVTGLGFARAQPGFVAPAATSLTYAWSSDDNAIARTSTGSGVSNAIQGVAFGTTTIRLRHTSTAYESADPVGGGAIGFNVIAQPPPPTALTASAITATSATIGWTNGATTGVTTTLQYRKNGTTTWTTASSTIAGGTSSYALGNLTASTKYDVQVWHVRDGLSSTITTATGLFTTSPPTPLSNFRVTSCVARQEGLKTYNYFTMSWSATTIAGSNFEIGIYHTSDATQAAVIVTAGATARSAEVGGYTAGTTLSQRWFWIRVNTGVPGPWVPLADNPLATNSCAFN